MEWKIAPDPAPRGELVGYQSAHFIGLRRTVRFLVDGSLTMCISTALLE